MNTLLSPSCKQYPMLRAALRVLQTLENAGYAAYIVGGFVRDAVMHTLGQSGLSHDIDIATNCPLPVLETLLPICADVGRNREFDILLVENNGFRFEVAQLRCGTVRPAGEALAHGPEDLLVDLAVRDFRINAMALDVSLHVHDPFGGRHDLRTGHLTCVNDPVARFAEDPLRMLRAVRFAVKFVLCLGEAERAEIRRSAADISKSAVERIWAELFAMCSLDGPRCAAAMALLAECGLMRHILPEIDVLRGFRHNPTYHPEGARPHHPGTVFDHVLAALRQNPEEDAELNLALLFHDIGKGVTARKKPGHDWHSFYGHDAEGVPLMQAVGERLRMPKQLVETLCYCIRNHMQIMQFPDMKAHKILRVVSDPRWPLLRKVHFCEDACRIGRFDAQRWQARMKIAETVLARQQAGAAVTGREVLAVCGIPPGPLVGEIMRSATARLMECEHCTPERVQAEILHAYKTLCKPGPDERS